MTAFERLSSLSDKNLSVRGVKNGVNAAGKTLLNVSVQYECCYVKDSLRSSVMSSVFGIGNTFEEACDDYLNKISGKVLIFETLSGNRETVAVL